jgi:hypothetical protein
MPKANAISRMPAMVNSIQAIGADPLGGWLTDVSARRKA